MKLKHSKQWYKKSADIEGDSEIGAGIPKRKEYWRMPDGTVTTDVVKQCRAWWRISRLLKKEFGFITIGFNPGFLLKTPTGDVFDISVDTATMLLDRLNRK